MNKLGYIKFHVILICKEDCILPAYLGSTLRGAIGRVIREKSCFTRQEDCSKCMNKLICPYTYCFNYHNPEEEGWMRGIQTKPNPFIIEPPKGKKNAYKNGDELHFDIILFENGIRYLPYFLYSVERMGENGLGMKNRKFVLRSIENSTTGEKVFEEGQFSIKDFKLIYWNDNEKTNGCNELKINFITPFRFKMDGKIHDSVSFEAFLRNIFRRASLLSAVYGDRNWDLNYKYFLERARHITVRRADLIWNDWKRYSCHKNEEITMGGIEGEVIFKGDLTLFIPYINVGTITHIGKGCTMGLGKYTYECIG